MGVSANLGDKIERIGFDLIFNVNDKEDTKNSEKLASIIENLSFSVLKPLLLDVHTNRIVYNILEQLPLIVIHSEKYDFSLRISKNEISIDYPESTPPPGFLEEKFDDKHKTVDLKIIEQIDKAITAILSAITTKADHPLEIEKINTRVALRIGNKTLDKLKESITDLRIDTDFNLKTDVISLKFHKEKYEHSYKFVIRKEIFIAESECACDDGIDLENQLEILMDQVEIFLKEQKVHAKT